VSEGIEKHGAGSRYGKHSHDRTKRAQATEILVVYLIILQMEQQRTQWTGYENGLPYPVNPV
jgi:hypothetical protein